MPVDRSLKGHVRGMEPGGKHHGVVGRREPLVGFGFSRTYAREWCYLASRQGLDPYHRWEECHGQH